MDKVRKVMGVILIEIMLTAVFAGMVIAMASINY